MSADGFYILWLFFVKAIKNTVSAYFYGIINCENPSSSFLQKACDKADYIF
jgi:hypothetical protein